MEIGMPNIELATGVLTAAHLTNREAALDGLSANEMSTTAATRQPARMHGKMMRGRYEFILVQLICML